MPPKENSLTKQNADQKNAAISRLPEFKTLDLTDDPEQVKNVITQIDAQANQIIAETVGAIEDQRFVMVGRCFIHLKSITDKGQYQDAIEELGYTYDQVKKQVKVTETYIKQALTRKKGIDALLGPGMLGTMARLFNRKELKALGDGNKVYGLSDKNLESMTQQQVVAHVRGARAERDEAIQDLDKIKTQRDKSHLKIKSLGAENSALEDKMRLLTAGPEDVQDVGTLSDMAINNILEAAKCIRQMNMLSQSEKAFVIMATTMKFSISQLRLVFDEIEGVESPESIIDEASMEATFEKIRNALGA